MLRKNCIRLAALLLMLTLLATPVLASAGDRLHIEREIYDFLTNELMLSTAAACGVLANIEHESSFQPTIVGDKGTSFGLCQWHNERWTALRAYSSALGLDYRTVEGQLAYLCYELGNNYTTLLLTLQSIDDTPDGAYRAAYLWCTQFERPSDMLAKGAARGELARNKYWPRYNNFKPVIMIQPEPEETEPRPEVLIEQLKQNPVTIPLPPEEPDALSGDHRFHFEKPPFRFYTPWNLPASHVEPTETVSAFQWEYPALAAIGAAMVLVVIFPEKKGKKKVYRQGRFMVR